MPVSRGKKDVPSHPVRYSGHLYRLSSMADASHHSDQVTMSF